MSKYSLKLNALSLAAQTRILKRISRDPEFCKKAAQTSVVQRERDKLRKESRSVHLARAFLKGIPLEWVELPYRPRDAGHVPSYMATKTLPDWDRIQELVVKDGARYYDSEQELLQRFHEWTEDIQFAEVSNGYAASFHKKKPE